MKNKEIEGGEWKGERVERMKNEIKGGTIDLKEILKEL